MKERTFCAVAAMSWVCFVGGCTSKGGAGTTSQAPVAARSSSNSSGPPGSTTASVTRTTSPTQPALQALSVDDSRFAREVLYTWTPVENAEQARAEKRLLVLHQSPTMGPAPFDLRVAAHGATQAKDAHISRMFHSVQGLWFRRFSWVAPWATRIPLGPVSYGDRLIRVKLKPDAIVGRFDPYDDAPWRFQDLSGREIDPERAASMKEKIAAVLHIKWKVTARRYEATRGGEVFKPIRSGYREYVICNEAMVAEWSMGTREIVDELRRERDLMQALSSEFDAVGNPGLTAAWSTVDFGQIWSSTSKTSTFVDDYGRALAFPMVASYSPTKDNLAAIASSLDATRDQGAEVRVIPNFAFDATPVPEHLRLELQTTPQQMNLPDFSD